MKKYIKQHFITLIAGSCGSGKTKLIEYIINSFKNFHFLLFISTTSFNNSIKTKIPIGYCQPSNCTERILKLQEIQKKNIKMQKNILIVFDDVSKLLKNNKEIEHLMSVHRHYNISIIFAAQYINHITPSVREIANYIILFAQNNKNAIKFCHENYFTEYDKNTVVKQLFMQLQKYYFIFFDKNENKKIIMTVKLS